MPRQDHFNIFLLMKRIENLQHHAAGKRKDGLNPLSLQAFDEDLSTGECHDNPPSNRATACMTMSASSCRNVFEIKGKDSRFYHSQTKTVKTLRLEVSFPDNAREVYSQNHGRRKSAQTEDL